MGSLTFQSLTDLLKGSKAFSRFPKPFQGFQSLLKVSKAFSRFPKRSQGFQSRLKVFEKEFGGMAVSDSQRDLVSVQVSSSTGGGLDGAIYKKGADGNRKLWLGLICSLLLSLGLIVALYVVSNRTTAAHVGKTHVSSSSSNSPSVCMTEGCVGAANMLLQNMDNTTDPCEDFYEFACGGFQERVVIPDDRSSRDPMAIMRDRLLEQLRAILEADTEEGESRVFTMARDVYKACMDEDKIEEIGFQPLKDMLHKMGGWPVLEGDSWDESSFSWIDTVYTFRQHGYSTNYLINFNVYMDFKNSSWRVINIDQADLRSYREYLINGMDDDYVKSYYNYMVNVAVLLGADRVKAEKELKESLLFEIELAHASQAQEKRRNATRLYNPMMIRDLTEYAPMVPWLEYINNILTEDLVQVDETERVILKQPGYLRNLTILLPKTSKKTIANYIFWRATQESLGYFNEAARKIHFEYIKNVP